MKNAVLIQARMGSTRLPGKVLMKLSGSEVLGHVIKRAQRADVGEVVVLTTIDRSDLPIVEYCSSRNVRVFCGSENDVLDRYWQAARLLEVDNVVRITADCPLLDSDVLSGIVREHCAHGNDYTSNTLEETFPDGVDVEVFRRSALEKAWREASLGSEREHVTPYIKKNPRLFTLRSIKNSVDLSTMRWTLDQEEDLRFLAAVYKVFNGEEYFGMKQILSFLQKNPEVGMINGNIVRNEGYLKSLKKD